MKTTAFTVLVLALLLAACAPATETATAPATVPAGKATLTGTTWAWIGFTDPTQQFSVENPLDYTLAFEEDGTVEIKADCNNASGTYEADGGALTIAIGPMTLAMCPPGSRSDDYLKDLGAAARYFFEDGNLYIDLMADGGTMTFAPSEVVTTGDGQGALAGRVSVRPLNAP